MATFTTTDLVTLDEHTRSLSGSAAQWENTADAIDRAIDSAPIHLRRTYQERARCARILAEHATAHGLPTYTYEGNASMFADFRYAIADATQSLERYQRAR